MERLEQGEWDGRVLEQETKQNRWVVLYIEVLRTCVTK